MGQTLNMNAFQMSAMKGAVDTVISPNTIPCYVDTGSVATLVPGDAVKLTTTAGVVIMVDKCLVTDQPDGFVLYNQRLEQFTAGMAIDVAFAGTIMYGEASSTVTRGDDLEFVPNSTITTGPKMKTSAGTNPISGKAFDNATDGQLFRFYVKGTVAFSPTVTGGTINNAPIGQSTAKAGKFTTLQTVVTVLTPGATPSIDPALGGVFTLTPGEDETITPASQKAGGELTLIVLTSGSTSRTLTFGSGFKSTGTLATGVTTAKTFVIKFVSDGTNYIEVSRTAAM